MLLGGRLCTCNGSSQVKRQVTLAQIMILSAFTNPLSCINSPTVGNFTISASISQPLPSV
jgi:hypothetical protein